MLSIKKIITILLLLLQPEAILVGAQTSKPKPTPPKTSPKTSLEANVSASTQTLGQQILVQAPRDIIQVNFDGIYIIRSAPAFHTYIELPEEPDGIFIGNESRFLIEPQEGNGASGNRIILIKPKKVQVEIPDTTKKTTDVVLDTNLTIRLISGKILTLLLRNVRTEGEHVYTCIFQSAIAQKETSLNLKQSESGPPPQSQPSELTNSTNPVDLELSNKKEKPDLTPQILNQIAILAATNATFRPKSENKFIQGEIKVTCKDQVIIASLTVKRKKTKAAIALTNPSWRIDSSEIPVRELAQFPTSLTTDEVYTGYFLFDQTRTNEVLSGNALNPTIYVSLVASGEVLELKQPLLIAKPSTEPKKVSPPVAIQDSINPTNPTNPINRETLTSFDQSDLNLTDLQSRFEYLKQTVNFKTASTTVQPHKEITGGLYVEKKSDSNVVLAIVQLERKLGNKPILIESQEWEANGRKILPITILSPFPSQMEVRPMFSGIVFQWPAQVSVPLEINFRIKIGGKIADFKSPIQVHTVPKPAPPVKPATPVAEMSLHQVTVFLTDIRVVQAEVWATFLIKNQNTERMNTLKVTAIEFGNQNGNHIAPLKQITTRNQFFGNETGRVTYAFPLETQKNYTFQFEFDLLNQTHRMQLGPLVSSKP